MSKAKQTPSPAAKLIEQQSAYRIIPDPSPEALAEVKRLLDHNDVAARPHRVSAEAATKMLQDMGWTGVARSALDSLCARHFGRKSYATK